LLLDTILTKNARNPFLKTVFLSFETRFYFTPGFSRWINQPTYPRTVSSKRWSDSNTTTTAAISET